MVLALNLGWACATNPSTDPVVSGVTPSEIIEARQAAADAVAARGCYLCLMEAAAEYGQLIQISADFGLMKKAVENDLMLAIREIELRLPDSGARQRAYSLRQHVTATYTAYFDALDALGSPLVAGGTTREEREVQRTARRELATLLERDWPASAMGAYFYLAMALNAGMVAELKPQLEALLDAHAQDLSLKYRVQAFLPTFSDAASAALLAQEPRFGEIHFLLGQRAILNADLVTAHRELTIAHEVLPDSAAIALVLGNVELAFARYNESLALFDQVLAAGADDTAQIGRAKAFSYLRQHQEAVTVLDDLLQDVRNNPGEKYYWRAWNRFQLGQTQPAYEDATTALKVMANSDAYRLAGMASFATDRLPEARRRFESSLRMNPADCDALRYLGQIDSIERDWTAAFPRFSHAATCYGEAIGRMSAELAEKEGAMSGLLAGQIASLRADIKQAQSLQVTSANNAAVTARNSGLAPR
jgi:tetratricopeptide (TPR) repeat protein